MKSSHFLIVVLSIFISTQTFAQNVGINADGSAPDGSAMLDVKSSNKGFLPPRVSATENVSSPATGLMVYQTEGIPGYYYYNGSSWILLGAASGASQWITSGNDIYYNSGNVGIGTAAPGSPLHLVRWMGSSYGLQIEGNSNTTGQPIIALKDNVDNSVLTIGNTAGKLSVMGGKVGIGTNSPQAMLDIEISTTGSTGGIRLNGYTTSTDVSYWAENQFAMMLGGIYKNVISSEGVSYFNGGNVGIGTDSPTKTLYVNGSAGGTQSWNQSSDARLKKDVKVVENGLSKVLALNPVTFNWKNDKYLEMKFDDDNHLGFIAQEVEKVVPQVVSTADDEMQTKSIAYSDLVPILTKAIQEQQQEIETLKKELDELKEMIQYKK